MKTRKEILCSYAGRWIPLGRARSKCPRCGADFGSFQESKGKRDVHATREVEIDDEGKILRWIDPPDVSNKTPAA